MKVLKSALKDPLFQVGLGITEAIIVGASLVVLTGVGPLAAIPFFLILSTFNLFLGLGSFIVSKRNKK